MTRFQITIRDIMWLMVVVGFACAWWVNRHALRTQLTNQADILIATNDRLAKAEDLLHNLGYTITDEGTSYTTPTEHWPARLAAEKVLKELLAGDHDVDGLFFPGAKEMHSFTLADVATQEFNPCKPTEARFEIALTGKTRQSRMILRMVKQANGHWIVDSASGVH